LSTLTQLRELIKTEIQDSSYGDSLLTALINRCYREVAGDVAVPALETTGIVTTDTSNPYTSLPDDFPDRRYNLQRVYSSNQDLLIRNIYTSFENFLDDFDDGLDMEGSIQAVCVRGDRLYYQPIPSTQDDLTLYYYSTPTALSEDGDIPTGIPTHLHEALFVNFACREIFAQQGLVDLWEMRNKLFQDAMNRLYRYAGPQARSPAKIRDKGEYIR